VHSVFGKINYGGLKHNSLYLGLVLPSGGDRASLKCEGLKVKIVHALVFLRDCSATKSSFFFKFMKQNLSNK
jgi:hypothetical protein